MVGHSAITDIHVLLEMYNYVLLTLKKIIMHRCLELMLLLIYLYGFLQLLVLVLFVVVLCVCVVLLFVGLFCLFLF